MFIVEEGMMGLKLSQMGNKTAFITEAGPEIGYGHLYRSLALAKEFIKRGEIIEFITYNNNVKSIIKSHLGDININSIISLKKDVSQYKYIIIDVFQDSWATYKSLIKGGHESKFVSIIDYAIKTDFIFAIGLQSYKFKEEFLSVNKEEKTRIFSGNDFFIFRDEFSKSNLPETKKEVQNVFISMGGSDPLDLTVQVLKSLEELDEKLNLKIVLGAGYNERRTLSLESLIAKSKHSINLFKNVSNIARLMSDCELAMINGGNTRFELAYLGIPFISVAINQKQNEISYAAEKIGIGINLGVYNEISNKTIGKTFKNLISNFEKRKSMSLKMKKTVNKNGTKRIYELLF